MPRRVMHLVRLLTIWEFAVLTSACGGGEADQGARAESSAAQSAPQQGAPQQDASQQVALPQTLCDLLPKADAERLMGKALVEQRNDESACHYGDARGTTGTGLNLDHNVFTVADQCRLVPHSQPLSGVGSEACIAFGVPSGGYATLVFGGGGRTLEVTAPSQDRNAELATAVAKFVLSKLGS